MKCPRCGTETNANFCGKCGAAARFERHESSQKPKFSPNPTLKRWLVFGLCVAVVGGLIWWILSCGGEVKIPETPGYYKNEGYGDEYVRYRIDKIDYNNNGTYLEFTITGKKVKDTKGADNAQPVRISWRLYNEDGYIIAGDTIHTPELRSGEKFEESVTVTSIELQWDEDYKLEIIDSR